MNILALLQARCSSSRLPGKVLKPLLGQPMLLRQIERVQRARLIEHLMIVTSVDPSDDALENLCARNGIECFRGSLDNVLDRFYQAAHALAPQHVVRLTGDCPLTDPAVIDAVIAFHLSGAYDYTSNASVPSFPDGLDVEVFRFSALQAAWQHASLPSEREHVTPYISSHPEIFKKGNFIYPRGDYSALRWTVDEAEDYQLVTEVYAALYPGDPEFATDDILRLIERRPELATLNTHYSRNEGLAKSLEKDRELGAREYNPPK